VRISADVGERLLNLGSPPAPAPSDPPRAESARQGPRSVPPRSVAELFERPTKTLDTTDRVAAIRVELTSRRVMAHNVLARVEGSDPTVRHELVVVGAHIDHDGIDGDAIFNGADDDGSGTVAVLEAAQAFAEAARAGWAPRRSVVLALWNAEEKGLLGSTHYTGNVLPAGDRPVANLNLDMIGRHEDIPRQGDPRFGGLPRRTPSQSHRRVHMLGYSLSPDLAELVREEAPRLGLTAAAEYDRHPVNLLRRSDHWPFLLAGVPALFLTTGLHPDYHTPEDDADRIDYDKLEKVARLAFRVVCRLADSEGTPRLAAVPTPDF
jgi:Zn-dependent M28 family amino/carboxypeptidase